MGRNNSSSKLSKQVASSLPRVLIDKEADFASIKVAVGIEAKSYIKDGIAFSENQDGDIIEIQILNLSKLIKKKAS